MATVSGTFTTDGLSSILRIRKTPETVAISVASGWASGAVVLERAVTASESAWVAIKEFSASTGFSGAYEAQPMERLRLRARNGFSGSCAYSMADGDAVVVERRNDNNEVVMRLLQSGDRIYRDLWVDGSLYVGGIEFTGDVASESAPGIVELATNAEAIAGVDTARAVTPANLAAAVTTHVSASSSSAAGKVELATDAEAIAGADTARAVTPANLAAAVTTHVAASSETTAGKVELATNAEAVTGTDTVRAVTPAGLAAAIAAIPAGTSPPWTLDATTRTGSWSATANKVSRVDTSGGASTATIPASLNVGDIIGFIDHAISFGTNNLTLSRNGHKINGVAGDYTANVSGVSVMFIYTGTTYGLVRI